MTEKDKNRMSQSANTSDSSLPTIPTLLTSFARSTLSRSSFSLGNNGSQTASGDQAQATNRAQDADVVTEAERIINEFSYKDVIVWALLIIGGLSVLKALATALLVFGVLFLPVLYIYLTQTCPKDDTFEAKKELKRVLQGQHLAEDHPDKPKGYFEKLLATATASVAVESAALSGYQQQMTHYGGAFTVASLKVPTQQIQLYWIGAAGEWRYVYTRSLPDNHRKVD